jgi:hypothetical protein
MEERLRIFVCVVAGGGVLGLIGAVFGALARVWFLRSGRASGAVIGSVVVRTLEEALRREFADTTRAAVAGGADGAFFLGLVGGALGAYAGQGGRERLGVLVAVLVGGLLLALGAVLFGAAGYALVRIGTRAVGWLFAGAMTGAVLGAWAGGDDGLLIGTLAGALLGTCASALASPRPPDT